MLPRGGAAILRAKAAAASLPGSEYPVAGALGGVVARGMGRVALGGVREVQEEPGRLSGKPNGAHERPMGGNPAAAMGAEFRWSWRRKMKWGPVCNFKKI